MHSFITLRTVSNEQPEDRAGHGLRPQATQSQCAPIMTQTSQCVEKEKGSRGKAGPSKDWHMINCQLPDFTALRADQLLRSAKI